MLENQNSLIFLKLGGSLITEKGQPMTPRLDILDRLMQEIYAALQIQPSLKLIIGHGSGSFGHSVGNQYNTRGGVRDKVGWTGFYKVYTAAKKLNQLVFSMAQEKNLPFIPFPLSTSTITKQRKIVDWDLAPLSDALQHGFIPLVNGDVAFDSELGGTILSTEEIFDYLAEYLRPDRILLAGIEPGIWEDYPVNTTIIKEIRSTGWQTSHINLQGSKVTDVTGGMKSKVDSMLEIIRRIPTCKIQIFSGLEPGSIRKVLAGEEIGTILKI